MKRTNEYLSDIMKKIDFIQERHKNKYNQELLIGFRGESKDYGKTSLMPSIFRDNSYVSKEKHLFELLCDYELVSHDIRNIDKAIETQHYVAISRMLDITFNAAVALYFACSENIHDNGYVYVFGFPEYYSPHSNYVEEFYSNILNSKSEKTYFKNFKVFSHSYSNDRIKAQSGGFVFFPGETFNPLNKIYYDKVVIHYEDKKKILKELDVTFHINEAKLFPEKDKIAAVIKEKFMNDRFLDENLTVKSEVISCFKRIDYELSLFNSNDFISILRYLRKEKEDLLVYLDKQRIQNISNIDRIKQSTKENDELYDLINEKFDMYTLMFKRRK